MEKNKVKWNSEESTATQMKQIISKGKKKSPKTQRTSQTTRYWDEGRVLKVGFLLVFVRAFARFILKGFSKFSPVFLFLFMIILGGGTLSLWKTSRDPKGLR